MRVKGIGVPAQCKRVSFLASVPGRRKRKRVSFTVTICVGGGMRKRRRRIRRR